ncbi:MAG TPA: hypothetical protein VN648_15840 [Candidatus Methylomirabilis sp.]|nr:hypothetical protein [Candidatus Methylomirabilis sp.]
MTFQNVLNSRYSVGLAQSLGRAVPLPMGYRIADWAGGQISRLGRTGIVQAVAANQRVVGGPDLAEAELARRVRAVFQNTGRCQFDFYHRLGRPEKILAVMSFSDEFERCLEKVCSTRPGEPGTLLVCPHLSNFELAGQAIALRGVRPLLLSFPQPKGGYQQQNQLRIQAGLETVPTSVEALRRATRTLETGGVVLTGVDRPIQGGKYRPMFFDRPASLPVMHVRLAMKLGIPITVIACSTLPDGTYRTIVSDPIPMQPDADLARGLVRNAEVVLRVIEKWIRQAPEQWSMFYPVWPEISSAPQGEA